MANHFRSAEGSDTESLDSTGDLNQPTENTNEAPGAKPNEEADRGDSVADSTDQNPEVSDADLKETDDTATPSPDDTAATEQDTSSADEEPDRIVNVPSPATISQNGTVEQQMTPKEPVNPYASLARDTANIPHEGTPTISFQDVTLIYPSQPNKPALQNVSVDIYPGEFVFIVGHSGSGKSTFIRLIIRALKATKGRVVVAGQDLTNMRNWKVPYLRRQIGCVFQDFKLLPGRTVSENVAFALECIGKPKSVIKAQVPEVLRLVGLQDRMDAFPDQLSGGEQQRVAVARAMVNRPPLLVCDEPTGNLDPAISLGIMKLLDRINRAGTTVVMATHDREMVDSMRRRVIALEEGHVVRDQERGGYGNYGTI
ncbi:MAG: cell division ATP-binding protein FtsE [Coriobacteriaceae bacterium]